MIQIGINPGALRRKATDLENKLNRLEEMTSQLIVLCTEEEGRQWDDMMRVDARPKIMAALLLAEKDLKEREPVPTTGSTATSTATAKGTTRKEAVTLPTFSGIEKPRCSPFLEYPVWLKNWNQHIVDYEEKSC